MSCPVCGSRFAAGGALCPDCESAAAAKDLAALPETVDTSYPGHPGLTDLAGDDPLFDNFAAAAAPDEPRAARSTQAFTESSYREQEPNAMPQSPRRFSSDKLLTALAISQAITAAALIFGAIYLGRTIADLETAVHAQNQAMAAARNDQPSDRLLTSLTQILTQTVDLLSSERQENSGTRRSTASSQPPGTANRGH